MLMLPALTARGRPRHPRASGCAPPIEQMISDGSSADAFRTWPPAVPALIEVLKDRTLPDIGNVEAIGRYHAVLAPGDRTSAGEAVDLLEILRSQRRRRPRGPLRPGVIGD
jgi:hypothetical protein